MYTLFCLETYHLAHLHQISSITHIDFIGFDNIMYITLW